MFLLHVSANIDHLQKGNLQSKVLLITDTEAELSDPLWYKIRTQLKDITLLQ